MRQENKYSEEYYQRQYTSTAFHKRGDKVLGFSTWQSYLHRMEKPGLRILEVGCGEGYLLKQIGQRYKTVGMDLSYFAIMEAKRNTHPESVQFCQADATTLPFHPNSFDVVIAFDVVEHLKNPISFFNESLRLLSVGGILIIKTPNPDSFGARLKKNRWHGARDNTHISIYHKADWLRMVRESGFEEIDYGTDDLWDSPYFTHLPRAIQKILFLSITIFLLRVLKRPFMRWSLGENFIGVYKKIGYKFWI